MLGERDSSYRVVGNFNWRLEVVVLTLVTGILKNVQTRIEGRHEVITKWRAQYFHFKIEIKRI
jgi:hypothetical protein